MRSTSVRYVYVRNLVPPSLTDELLANVFLSVNCGYQNWVSRIGVPMENGVSRGAVNCAPFVRISGLRGGGPYPTAENSASRGNNCRHTNSALHAPSVAVSRVQSKAVGEFAPHDIGGVHDRTSTHS